MIPPEIIKFIKGFDLHTIISIAVIGYFYSKNLEKKFIKELGNRIDPLEKKVDALGGKIAQIDARIIDIEKRVAVIETRLDSIDKVLARIPWFYGTDQKQRGVK